MHTESIIYRRVTARLAELGMHRRELADILGVSYGTLHNKLCGITPWTWNEVRVMAVTLGFDVGNNPYEDMLRVYTIDAKPIPVRSAAATPDKQ